MLKSTIKGNKCSINNECLYQSHRVNKPAEQIDQLLEAFLISTLLIPFQVIQYEPYKFELNRTDITTGIDSPKLFPIVKYIFRMKISMNDITGLIAEHIVIQNHGLLQSIR